MAIFNFIGIKVSGISTVVPKQVVLTESYKETFGSEEVDKFMKMTGIRQTRRTLKYQTASDMAYTAAQRLLEHKGIDPIEIKALVFGTHSPDYRRPASAFVVQKRLGLSNEAAVFDISLGCSSTVYGLQVVASMMQNSDIDKAILIIGDTASKTTNPKDRASIMLVGEASVALLLEKDESAAPIRAIMRSDGEGYRYLIVPGGGYRNIDASNEEKICKDDNPRHLNNSFMQGTSVFTFTISDVPRAIKDYLKLTETTVDDYDVFAFHQANSLILKQIARKLKISPEKMPLTLPEYGNTSGASQILTLCDKYGAQTEGSINALLVGFGVGISWGVTALELEVKDILSISEDDSFFVEGFINSVNEL
ncbi:ketoacyl-ACP synthase III [Akkermansiaceae bacterium]|nr:ketoacyl-ACP synthase III [Akkermansiaceae bacterium]